MSINAYIFLGPELGKKQEAVNSIKDKFKNAEISTFYSGETPVNEIADTLLNCSLFTEARIIFVKNAELIKKKDEIELLVSCVKDMDDNTVLIFLSDDNRLTVGFEDAFLQAGVSKNNCQVFYEMFEREKNEWLKQYFKNAGYDIDKDSIATILEMVENNTESLKRECSRLIHFLSNKTKGQTDMSKGQTNSLSKGQTDSMSLCIEEWLSHNREESAFTLFSRIAYGDLSKALESMAIMSAAKQSAPGILASLAWCFRKLYDYLTLVETGNANNSFELKKIGLSSPRMKDDYAAAARRYNFETVEACLTLTAEYDKLLRSPAAALESLLMDRYILSVININTNTNTNTNT
ncbi:MAG: hypothetical protein FWD13_05265, partial [Treponema sp.]|nr:hypothetical protein [Treponema sp.]